MKRHSDETRAAAAALHAGGMPLLRVAKTMGISHATLRNWLEPSRKAVVEAYRRGTGAARALEWSRRARYRKMARDEAAETGEDVEAVYERYGVATRRMSKPTNNGD